MLLGEEKKDVTIKVIERRSVSICHLLCSVIV